MANELSCNQISRIAEAVGQRDFWDEQIRVAKLKQKKPVLDRLWEMIPGESFRPLHGKGYTQERKSNNGRKRIDPLIHFEMLLLQQLFNLSNEELGCQVNDRHSFEQFGGLGVMNNITDLTTVPFFREELRREGVIEELFEIFETYLRSQGLQNARRSDYQFKSVTIPQQGIIREENTEIKAGRLANGLDQNPDRMQQRNLDAHRARRMLSIATNTRTVNALMLIMVLSVDMP